MSSNTLNIIGWFSQEKPQVLQVCSKYVVYIQTLYYKFSFFSLQAVQRSNALHAPQPLGYSSVASEGLALCTLISGAAEGGEEAIWHTAILCPSISLSL